MKRQTFVDKLEEQGYQVFAVEDGIAIYDTFGWRAFVSDKVRYGINTCGLQLPTDDFNAIIRYSRTPLEKR